MSVFERSQRAPLAFFWLVLVPILLLALATATFAGAPVVPVSPLSKILAGELAPNFEVLRRNDAPCALGGGANFVTQTSAVAPSIIIDDLEMELPREDMPKLPVVPAQPLARLRESAKD